MTMAFRPTYERKTDEREVFVYVFRYPSGGILVVTDDHDASILAEGLPGDWTIEVY